MSSRLLLLLLAISLFSISIFSQTITATIKGTVKDDFGRPVVSAVVTVKDESQQVVSTAKTDQDGHYEVTDLPIGNYNLTVECDGLKSEAKTDIKLAVASENISDLRMQANLEAKAIKKIGATYPEAAKATMQQGRVIVGVLVKPDGTVDKVLFLAGNTIFKSAALDAAQKWQFQKSINGYSGRIAFGFKLIN